MGSCDRHQEVIDRLDNHENRIKDLEISDAKMGEKLDNLIKQLENLAAWIKALVILGGTSLVGFFFWYIQNIK